MSEQILVRYGELSTKGRNKKRFVQQLAQNIRQVFQAYPMIKIQPTHDYLYLNLHGAPSAEVLAGLKNIFGIQSYSLVHVLKEREFSVWAQQVVEIVREQATACQTFKVATKRSDHTYALDTTAINRELGAVLLAAYPHLQVQLKQPDLQVKVEVRNEAILVTTQTFAGAGGLPVGSSGRGMLMLSGGIDSPVAGYLAMKRGLILEAVHFYSPPYTSEQSLLKTKKLAQQLTRFGGHIQFLTVPFTKIQELIKENVPEGYLMTIMRRMMLRITDALREQRKGLVVVNGESVGQVASQTLHSMIAINDVTTTPIIRPVATMDKLDIIALAEAIDTFELSIQPFDDCCSIFAPPSPKTQPKLDKVYAYEARLAVDELVAEAVAQTSVENITRDTVFGAALQQEIADLL